MALAAWALFLPAAGLLAQSRQKTPTPTPDVEQGSILVSFRNAAPGVAYVGSKACANCHSDIYQEYSKTAMGRSVSLASDPAQLALVSSPVTLQQGNRYFEVSRKGDALYQTVYELGADGHPLYRHTEQLLYAFGAGGAGYTYVVQRGNRLYEAPLSYFSTSSSWEVSPGYSFENQVFDRAVIFQCVVCHTGRTEAVAQVPGTFRDHPVEQLTIGCENCHGPGELHVRQRMHGAPLKASIDDSIVNPSKLPSWLANNICMECHEGGDARVVQTGKTVFDFRPGKPLDSVVAIFREPPSPASATDSPHLAYFWSLSMSKCFISSGSKMTCFTCHDPHAQPSGQQAVEWFRNKCLTCHSNLSCRLPLVRREAQTPANNCFGCHMPEAKAPPGTHADQIDHRIVTSAGEAPPDGVFHWTTPELRDLVHVDAVPNNARALSLLTVLQAYQEIAISDPQRYEQTLLSVLARAASEDPDDPVVLLALADQSHMRGNEGGRAEAIEELSRVVELGAAAPQDYVRLGGLLAESDLVERAVPVLERAAQLNPYNKDVYPLLALSYFSLRQDAQAHRTIQQWLTLFPEDYAKAAGVEKEAANDFRSQ